MTKTVDINGIIYNVYADTCEADTYNNAIVGSTWNEKTDTVKKQYLVMASRKIDSYNYAGKKVSDDQPLKFPRVMTTGKVSDDEVLTNLCCQLATFYNDNGSTNSANSDFINSVSDYEIGDLKVKFKDDATLDLSGLDDYIEKALQEWVSNQGMSIWL